MHANCGDDRDGFVPQFRICPTWCWFSWRIYCLRTPWLVRIAYSYVQTCCEHVIGVYFNSAATASHKGAQHIPHFTYYYNMFTECVHKFRRRSLVISHSTPYAQRYRDGVKRAGRTPIRSVPMGVLPARDSHRKFDRQTRAIIVLIPSTSDLTYSRTSYIWLPLPCREWARRAKRLRVS
jgi:hypothetical protein